MVATTMGKGAAAGKRAAKTAAGRVMEKSAAAVKATPGAAKRLAKDGVATLFDVAVGDNPRLNVPRNMEFEKKYGKSSNQTKVAQYDKEIERRMEFHSESSEDGDL